MGYRVAADVVVVIHFAFLAYVIGGGFLALRWRWSIWPHLGACTWAIAILTVPGLVCPLTTAEAWARHRAGDASYSGAFINQYIEGVLYPARLTPLVEVLVGASVLTSWALVIRLRRRDRRDPISRKAPSVRRA
jgi:hypothetical protein